jgi:hypothetical protein
VRVGEEISVIGWGIFSAGGARHPYDRRLPGAVLSPDPALILPDGAPGCCRPPENIFS